MCAVAMVEAGPALRHGSDQFKRRQHGAALLFEEERALRERRAFVSRGSGAEYPHVRHAWSAVERDDAVGGKQDSSAERQLRQGTRCWLRHSDGCGRWT